MRDYILLYINGQRHEVRESQAFIPLSDYLRYHLAAVGTKVVCAEGDCGACTVMLGRPRGDDLAYQPVNSCIQYMYQLDGTHIITIEGLKDGEALNPVQEAMVQCHGAQCGYCTPGFVVTLCGLLDQSSGDRAFSEQDVRDALTGNLCRCTGYEPIIQAGLQADGTQWISLSRRYPPSAIASALRDALENPVRIEAPDFEGQPRLFYDPRTIEQAVAFKAEHPEAVPIQGGTDVSVVCNKRGFEPAVVMSLGNLGDAGLDGIVLQPGEPQVMAVGAKASLMQLESFCQTHCPQLHQILLTFGGPQIKYAGTLAGNVANGSPIGDSIPFLMVMEAEVELASVRDTRRIPIVEFYLGYKKLAMAPDELITRILCPLPGPDETLRLYKVSRRKHLDISTFTAAVLLRLDGDRITAARIAYGGVGPVVLRLEGTEAFLTGKPMTLETFEEAGRIARGEITPITDVRGSADYRYQLAENILLKCFYEISPQAEAVPV